MPDPLYELAERLHWSRTIAFVGAGCSVDAGYPSWHGLLQRLYERLQPTPDAIPRPDSGTDVRWLAEIYAAEIRRNRSLDTAVEEELNRADPGTPQTLHRLLATLPFNHFITTNYDHLIEEACDENRERREGRLLLPSEKCRSLNARDSEKFSEFLDKLARDLDEQMVLHLHGMLNDRVTLSWRYCAS